MQNEAVKILLERTRDFLKQHKAHMLDENGNYSSEVYIDSNDYVNEDVIQEFLQLSSDKNELYFRISNYIVECFMENIFDIQLEIATEIFVYLDKNLDSYEKDFLKKFGYDEVENIRKTLVEHYVINVGVNEEEILKNTQIKVVYTFEDSEPVFFNGNVLEWLKHTKNRLEEGETNIGALGGLNELLLSQGYSIEDFEQEVRERQIPHHLSYSIFLKTLIDTINNLNYSVEVVIKEKTNLFDYLLENVEEKNKHLYVGLTCLSRKVLEGKNSIRLERKIPSKGLRTRKIIQAI